MTESDLAIYMAGCLQSLAKTFGWLDETTGDPLVPSFQPAINETVDMLGVAIADENDELKVKAVGKYQIFRQALTNAISNFDWSAEGRSFSEGQMFERIKKAMELALSDLQSKYGIAINQPAIATIKWGKTNFDIDNKTFGVYLYRRIQDV